MDKLLEVVVVVVVMMREQRTSVWSVRHGQRVGKIAGVGYGAEVGVFGGEGASWDVPGTSVRLKRARRSAVLGTKRAGVRLRMSLISWLQRSSQSQQRGS